MYKKFSLFLFSLMLILTQLSSAEDVITNDMFNPPFKIENRESPGSLDPKKFSSSEDNKWISGILHAVIRAEFDGAILLDVGFKARPYPTFRTDESHGIGNGVLIFSIKDNRIYIYDQKLFLISPRKGIDTQDFLYALESAKSDPIIKDHEDDKDFLKYSKFLGTGAVVLYATQLLSHQALDGFVITTGLLSLSTFGQAMYIKFKEGKIRILNRLLHALKGVIRSSENYENQFFRTIDSKTNEYPPILKQVIKKFVSGENVINSCRHLFR